jgi:septum formation protein
MTGQLILASGSRIRAELLENAGVQIIAEPARIDEESMKQAMQAESVAPRDMADALAEAKAKKVSRKHPGGLVLGCDQVLAFKGEILSKPIDQSDAIKQLELLSGQTHNLYSAAVLYERTEPIWRHVGHVRLSMRDASQSYIKDYVTRNWDSIQESVGAYKLEEEGVRFFSRIEGDYFHVLGLPLLELLSYLTLRGTLQS